MNLSSTDPAALARRREQILQMALHAAARRRRLRWAGHGMRAAVVVALGGLAWRLVAPGAPAPAPIAMPTPDVTSVPSSIAQADPSLPAASPAHPYRFVQFIEPRAGGYDHLVVRTHQGSVVQMLDDDALLRELAALRRPAVLVTLDGGQRLLMAAGG